jgi:hypothetical protein
MRYFCKGRNAYGVPIFSNEFATKRHGQLPGVGLDAVDMLIFCFEF